MTKISLNVNKLNPPKPFLIWDSFSYTKPVARIKTSKGTLFVNIGGMRKNHIFSLSKSGEGEKLEKSVEGLGVMESVSSSSEMYELFDFKKELIIDKPINALVSNFLKKDKPIILYKNTVEEDTSIIWFTVD